ncbi:MAG: hypothetical protein COU63_01850 [Candidatus Pacebacteria bacterium CG10_big_fil_rev_8_21_14_0_10_36_11]|nr:lamin tail domain-containing protein [Candidatus Pacearchaeota archaeon]OIP73676.1 MAG: hypothetical protein AUK08_03875 [Candidatus Pacebacteria bacterium CG2_30_36_39]PIR64742.1 MAG: hypothetical protein COU63_01850 [Candidatus Pacebacteria bacterium CG10_big_fil_rev_8_21_14_0_10_36_11]PJC43191.1 MAG: hypothetical protein CO040_00475 [Candidatus Pacebacteria bacterium CG_4_9_14_0_2_um_filter_36_8]
MVAEQIPLVISEIYPNPQTGEPEWIEIYNPNIENINLAQWEVWDQESQPSLIYNFNDTEQIKAKQYLSLEFSSALNNSGDSIILKNNVKQIIDSMTYEESKKGYSWVRNEILPEEKPWLGLPSRDKANIIPTLTPTSTPTLAPTLVPTTIPTTANPKTTPSVVNQKSEPNANYQKQKKFVYPQTILNPKIQIATSEVDILPSIYAEPAHIETGALSVIMGSLLLLIPGLIYVKNKQQLL